MGDPKVQRSGDGFFTRFGRAIDALGKDDARSAKPAAKEAKAVELKPLPGKYKSSPRRLDRSVVSKSDPAASTIRQNEAYVTNALKLADDMRALAVKEDSAFNRTTPKDVDKVTNKYKPLLLVVLGATAFEKSEARKQLAEMMVKELFQTPTGHNLLRELRESPLVSCVSIDTPVWSCGSSYECSAGGYSDTYTGIGCASSSESSSAGDKCCPDFSEMNGHHR